MVSVNATKFANHVIRIYNQLRITFCNDRELARPHRTGQSYRILKCW